MNGMDSQKRDAIARKAWCQAIVKLPSAYATSRDIAKLLNVCKTKAIQILKAAGACRATERTVDRGDTATISSEEDRMDVTNNMNDDPSSISRRSLVLRSTGDWWVNTTFKLDI